MSRKGESWVGDTLRGWWSETRLHCTIYYNQSSQLSGWLSGKGFTCRCRKLGFDPWSRKIPHAKEPLSLSAQSPCSATREAPARRSLHIVTRAAPTLHSERKATARESPQSNEDPAQPKVNKYRLFFFNGSSDPRVKQYYTMYEFVLCVKIEMNRNVLSKISYFFNPHPCLFYTLNVKTRTFGCMFLSSCFCDGVLVCGLLLILACDKQHCYGHVHKYASSFAGQILTNKNAESKKCLFHVLMVNCQFAFQQDIPNLNTWFTLLYSRS